MSEPLESEVPDDPAVTAWIRSMRRGESAAAEGLWREYYGKLVALARRKLEGRSRLVDNEEDVALSAFKSFCRGVKENRYPDLDDREGLWKLLVTITIHKALNLIRNETRQKRGGDLNRREASCNDSVSIAAVERLIGPEPTPELAAELVEEYERLLGLLDSAELVELAVLKMEGYANHEIAARWGKAERTVERKLQLIRRTWERERDATEGAV